MKLSYLVTVKDELKEIRNLITQLLAYKEDVDEIVVLQDGQDTETYNFLAQQDRALNIFYNTYSLNDDFASFKNYGKGKCDGDYIFQIDADEIVSTILLENIKTILSMNESVELYWLPRVNTVKGLTDEWVKRWGWRLTNNENYDDPLVNWPDYQSRLFKNKESINWTGRVHEVLTGALSVTHFPAEIEYALYHEKQLDKQIKQNEYYSRIIHE